MIKRGKTNREEEERPRKKNEEEEEKEVNHSGRGCKKKNWAVSMDTSQRRENSHREKDIGGRGRGVTNSLNEIPDTARDQLRPIVYRHAPNQNVEKLVITAHPYNPSRSCREHRKTFSNISLFSVPTFNSFHPPPIHAARQKHMLPSATSSSVCGMKINDLSRRSRLTDPGRC
ncbi:hypothetical protein CEXT_538012 [Caerostris extrusa]|uniref:Uncharacterized protein n=1 Tax=Caerostris extrusa TaxID=172846 RepID=A0AAV4XKF9_CAEEX|nr:hypothetical protein CEXT_538012 [Caerostris extrusa]